MADGARGSRLAKVTGNVLVADYGAGRDSH
jgi:hypothetical protein